MLFEIEKSMHSLCPTHTTNLIDGPYFQLLKTPQNVVWTNNYNFDWFAHNGVKRFHQQNRWTLFPTLKNPSKRYVDK